MPTALLFSDNSNSVHMAQHDLRDHSIVYWTLPKSLAQTLSFPLWGYIHTSRDQVRHRARVIDALAFAPAHYENPMVKPAPWRHGPPRPEGTTLILDWIECYSIVTTTLSLNSGGFVQHPPENFVYISDPDA